MCSIHLAVTLVHTRPGIKARFVDDVRTCLEDISRSPNDKCSQKVSACPVVMTTRQQCYVCVCQCLPVVMESETIALVLIAGELNVRREITN
jgi:hypothetical protein